MTAAGERRVMTLDHTHHPNVESWVKSANGHSDFPIQNLPFGVFEPVGSAGRHETAGPVDRHRVGPTGGIRIGDMILDLRALATSGLLAGTAQVAANAAAAGALNGLFALGTGPRQELRRQVFALLTRDAGQQREVAPLLYPLDETAILLPAAVGDYTDFYAGIHHATNVGGLFRPDNPLLPNYKWVPIGYHGRASTVTPSGVPFHRPNGQVKSPADPTPVFGPTERLDFELEIGVWVGPESQQGQPIPIDRAAEHVAGYCLLNDWSARDVQAWEYQPLGPFLSKSFATTVSGWVITPEALAPFRASAPARPAGDPDPLPYLTSPADQLAGGLDLELEVLLSSAAMRASGAAPQRLSISSTRHMYWTVAQLIAHHTSGGCDLRAGDLLGSGTISGPDAGGFGSLLEMTRGGREPVTLPNGETRMFLRDGDEVVLRARANRPGAASIGFGDCRAIVQPALLVSRPVE
jgi:fumarylacetoacetase